MAIPHQVRRGVLAVLLLIAFVLQGTTSVLAGTTGVINGSVVDPQSNQPVSGARVTATSASQSAVTTTGADGKFSFISLNPDTYTISVAETSTRDASSTSGVTVQADQTVNVSLTQPTKLKQIGSVTSRAAGALVKPGTTADVYSINAVTQDKASGVGGGGNLNSAWSAIATVPGVFIAPNQAGYIGAGASISIRGGDYDQIGYELDGVPVNRAFDNYPSGSLSSLGQQELQVYTGATPANSEAEGISGYINQVIRTGTAPASRNLTLAIGTPIFYNKVAFEAGGANPAPHVLVLHRCGRVQPEPRYYDQYNGASLQQNYGAPLTPCGGAAPGAQHRLPSARRARTTPTAARRRRTSLGPYQYNAPSGVQDRDTVANFHFGLPRKDGNKDDIQLLFDNNFINNPSYDSTNDLGGREVRRRHRAGRSGVRRRVSRSSGRRPARCCRSATPAAARRRTSSRSRRTARNLGPARATSTTSASTTDASSRTGATRSTTTSPCVKLQYQHNFGTNAFLRVYGYTYYSNWLQTGPQSNYNNYIGYVPSDYELSSHTRGVSVNFSDQLNSQHLLSVQGSYTTATTLRDNNTQNLAGAYPASRLNGRTVVGLLVDATNPLNGICYAPGGVPTNCFNNAGSDLNRGPTHGGIGPQPGFFNILQAANGTRRRRQRASCGGGPCQYLVVENGTHATYNTVVPKFSAFSITDQWKPTDRLNINLGLRYDRFEFDGSSTTATPARTFFYNAFNQSTVHLAQPWPAQVNASGQTESYSVLQPRLGMTYTVNPTTVLRASYGRYAQAPNSAFEQYNFLQQDAPPALANFVRFGIGNTPAHAIRPEVSNNYDFSYEHQFKGDTSIKFTPFLRKTQDQIQQFFLDQKTNFVSGLNVGRQTSEGFELEVDKGDFSRNGLAGAAVVHVHQQLHQLLALTQRPVRDRRLQRIRSRQYNAFTAAGGGRASATPPPARPTTRALAGSIANPYYNAPVQPLMDVNGNYATFDTFPGGIGAGGYTSFGAPYVSTLIVQYKHGPLAITPALQFSAGSRFGVPMSTPGIDPTSCAGGLGGSTAGDPRYPYGAAGRRSVRRRRRAAPLHLDPRPVHEAFRQRRRVRFTEPAPAAHADHVRREQAPHAGRQLREHHQPVLRRNPRAVRSQPRLQLHVHVRYHRAGHGHAGAGRKPIQSGERDSADPGDARICPTFPGYPFNMYFEARIKL